MDYKAAKQYLIKVLNYESIVDNVMAEYDLSYFLESLMNTNEPMTQSNGVALFDGEALFTSINEQKPRLEETVAKIAKRALNMLSKMYCGDKYEDVLLHFFEKKEAVQEVIEDFHFIDFCTDFSELDYDQVIEHLEYQLLNEVIEGGIMAAAIKALMDRDDEIYHSDNFDTVEKVMDYLGYEERMKEAYVFYDELPQASPKARLNNIKKMDMALKQIAERIVSENDNVDEYAHFIYHVVPKRDFFERLEQSFVDYGFVFQTVMEQKSHLPETEFFVAALNAVLSTLYQGEPNMDHPPLLTKILLLRDLEKNS